jgi:hypothetical protein
VEKKVALIFAVWGIGFVLHEKGRICRGFSTGVEGRTPNDSAGGGQVLISDE